MAYYKGWKTVAETAEMYGVTPMTVRRWLKAGYLTGIRLGPRVLLVDPDSIVNKGAVI